MKTAADIAATLRERLEKERKEQGWWAAHELLDQPEDLERFIQIVLDEAAKAGDP